MFFKKPTTRPQEPIYYPDGFAVNTEKADYFIKGGKRYRFFSRRVKESWNIHTVIGSEVSVSGHKLSKYPMGFRDGTLIHNVADGKMYLISNNKRRHIVNPDVAKRYNLKAIVVSKKETLLHEEGDELD